MKQLSGTNRILEHKKESSFQKRKQVKLVRAKMRKEVYKRIFVPCSGFNQHVSDQQRTTAIKHPKVINLSDFELTEIQKTLLFKGLKFTPTPYTNIFELKSDIRNFSRKLRLVEVFATEQVGQEETEESMLRNPSSFCPPVNRNKELDAAINFINWKGINDLKHNDDIIIKEADKVS